MAHARRVAPILAVVLLLAGCGGASPRERASARRPANESPREIVEAFFAAMHAHDPAAARPLVTPAYLKVVNRPGTWLRGAADIKLLDVSHGFNYGPIDGYRYSWWVGAGFVLSHQQGITPMEDGANSYGYILVRNSPSEGWRIGDEGLG